MVSGALASKLYLAGNIPMPTVPLASIHSPQSPGPFTLAIGVPPVGAPELPLESAWLHPPPTSSPQSAAAPSKVRGTRSVFIVRFSLKIMALKIFFGPQALSRAPHFFFLGGFPFGSPRAFSVNGTQGKQVEPARPWLLRALRLRRHHIPARPLMQVPRQIGRAHV